MKKFLVIACLSIIAQQLYAEDKKMSVEERDYKAEALSYAMQAKKAVGGAIKVMSKHPMPTVKVLLGGIVLSIGAGKLIATPPSLFSYLVETVKGVPLIALGIFLVGNGIDDVEKSR